MACHWTWATCSWFISFFANIASHVPWLASSCKDQFSDRTDASASHGGVGPTHWPAVDDSISIVVDVSLPMDDRAICAASSNKNACGTRSTTTTVAASSQPSPVHPIAALFRSQELGKAVLGFTVPMITGLLFNQHQDQGLTHLQASWIALALSVGFAATWNGMLQREVCPRVARTLEHFGVGSILVAFFGLVSSFLPPSLAWVCWLCCGLSCLPFLLCLAPQAAVEEERSVEWVDQCIV
ncbi:hypothetical protein ACJRO7_028451 [Eucalyptus globulus]|uniref:Uncharacterized protein n=1 Tax=Eucalyptus globulus TaxID=34317 RepID=A0ABD3JUH8_EUCGL